MFFALGLGLLAIVISTVSTTIAIMTLANANAEIVEMQEEIDVYEIYVNNLTAWLKAQGLEPPE